MIDAGGSVSFKAAQGCAIRNENGRCPERDVGRVDCFVPAQRGSQL